jgi:CheY-like chemotaxis protein
MERRARARILIVEDNTQVANGLARLLDQAGYTTHVFHSGGAALAFAEQSPPDAALIDIHLPDLSGLVLTQKLRARMGPEAPIIVVSGDDSMEVINSLPHVGATRFYRKPVRYADLVEHLQEAVS